jgi:nitroreductase
MAAGHEPDTQRNHVALREAAGAALYAPSGLKTQPWRWRLHESTLELRRDVDRQLRSIDASGRLATLRSLPYAAVVEGGSW